MKLQMLLVGLVTMSAVQLGGASLRADQPKFGARVEVEGRAVGRIRELTVRFSGPVSLPGISLAPGAYIFRQPSANVVQVAGLGGEPYRMYITIPIHRDTAEDRYSVVLGPSPAPDSPQRIVAMFAPGELTGQQFVYSNR